MSDDLDPCLQAAINDAVDDVEPTDRLAAIREQTRASGSHRRGWYAAGGSLLAAAAAVTVIVAVTGSNATTAADPAAIDPATTAASSTASSTAPIQVYYVGPGPDRMGGLDSVLYSSLETGDSALELLMQTPSDPDYRTLWPEGSLVSYTATRGEIDVVVGPNAPLDDELAHQQLIFTLQTIEQTRVPVTLTQVTAGNAMGSSLDLTFQRADDLEILSHMSITEPVEGSTYQRDAGPMEASGEGNSFEANANCSLLDSADQLVVGPLIAQMSGYLEPRLFPWEVSVDLSDVPPGTYTFACVTDDPTGGSEGRGVDTDTRTVIVE